MSLFEGKAGSIMVLSAICSALTNIYLYFIPGDKWAWSYDGVFSILELVIGFPIMLWFLWIFWVIVLSFILGGGE